MVHPVMQQVAAVNMRLPQRPSFMTLMTVVHFLAPLTLRLLILPPPLLLLLRSGDHTFHEKGGHCDEE